MENLEELKALYEEALAKENEFRLEVYVPAANKLNELYEARESLWNKMDEIILHHFKEKAGDFVTADFSQLDMEWFLSINTGMAAYKYRQKMLAKTPIKDAGHYNPETNQTVLQVSVPSRADRADIEEIKEWIEKFLPYIKPYGGHKYHFDVFDDMLSEREHIILYSDDGKHWVVKDSYYGGIKDEGMLRTMLEYIRAYHPYN